jgi:inner membrane protein
LRDLRAHAVQFLLVGGSITLFYLMLLALAEHVPFAYAYAGAAILDLAAVSLYVGRTVSRAAGITVAILLALVRAFMFLLLREEDASLLIGSIGLFAALAAVMYATRNVDWYRIGTTTRYSVGDAAGRASVRA